MPESQGQIHGLISREQAWEMWKPYGERGVVDESPDSLNSGEAVLVATGYEKADGPKIISALREIVPKGDQSWLEDIRDVFENGDDTEHLRTVLANSHEQQTGVAEQATDELRERDTDDLRIFGESLVVLAQEGLVADQGIDAIRNRLFDSSGNPLVELKPQTMLAYARLFKESSTTYPDSISPFADLDLGIIWLPMMQSKDAPEIRQHNKNHETIHAYVQGSEIHDITRDTGQRLPRANRVGVFGSEPHSEIRDDNDYAASENAELNEVWTEAANRIMLAHDPRLGQALPLGEGGYDPWLKHLEKIARDEPAVFRAINRAVLAEATPADPEAKTAAIARMHEIADKAYGMPDALTAVITGQRTMLDVHSGFMKSKDKR